MKYSKLFLQLRKELELNQSQMAKKLKCSQASLSKIESGESRPGIDVLIEVIRLTMGNAKSSENMLDKILFP